MQLHNKRKKSRASHRVALVGIFVALALIFSYVEVLLPISIGIPGVKLGIANLVIVTGLYLLSFPEVCLISLLRILITGILFGNWMSLAYSFAGGALSLFGMLLLKKIGICSIYGVSILGAVLHNIGQIAVAVLVTKTPSIFYYLPILMGVGILTGGLIGFLSGSMLRVLERSRIPGLAARDSKNHTE